MPRWVKHLQQDLMTKPQGPAPTLWSSHKVFPNFHNHAAFSKVNVKINALFCVSAPLIHVTNMGFL